MFGGLRAYYLFGPREVRRIVALSGMDVPEVLDAAHIGRRRQRSTDDPRHGLVLCGAS